MAGLTDYSENNTINWIFRGVTFPTPGGIYIGLFTVIPSADAGTGGTEVSGGSYARQSVTRNTTEWKDPSTATQGTTSNVNAITFPTASANWGTVVAAAIHDAVTAGNMLAFGALAANKIVNTGDVLKFNAGDLVFTLD